MLSKSNQHERLIFNGLMDIGGMYSNFVNFVFPPNGEWNVCII
uniref:Uncharacterized protein n=1 Tax=Anguilla anguilla TaxID=7936 RepID=A0A0E9TPM8_ANGAN